MGCERPEEHKILSEWEARGQHTAGASSEPGPEARIQNMRFLSAVKKCLPGGWSCPSKGTEATETEGRQGLSGLLPTGRPSGHVGEQPEMRLDRWAEVGLREG